MKQKYSNEKGKRIINENRKNLLARKDSFTTFGPLMEQNLETSAKVTNENGLSANGRGVLLYQYGVFLSKNRATSIFDVCL